IGGRHGEDRLVADHVLDEVAGPRDLFVAACHLPHTRPQPLHLQVDELPRDVALLRDQVGHGRLRRYSPSTSPTCSSASPTPSPSGRRWCAALAGSPTPSSTSAPPVWPTPSTPRSVSDPVTTSACSSSTRPSTSRPWSPATSCAPCRST